ncbi:hypothetical protein [Nocardioides campestrisoli]|uniref:hypothetical protein n=1 Tax=Nocardioides campestrisoli TaxID=2736757 RepID=UPI0015E7219C|nr:hypothetical protein [Nocardioides campestrisoli]
MRALSIRQPYTWAVLAGGKDVENRSRNIAGSYRGPVLIHAALQLADLAGNEEVTELASVPVPTLGRPRAGVSAQLGGIVGMVDLVGVHHSDACSGSCSAWAHPTGFHLRLEHPVVFPRMVRCPGRLGLWSLAPDVRAGDGTVLQQVARWVR